MRPFDRLPLDVEANLVTVANAAFRRLVRDVELKAKENVTRGRPGLISRTGRLYRSIKRGPYKQWQPGGYGEQRVFTRVPYAHVHEFGAVIHARSKPWLVFRIWMPWDTDRPTGPWRRARQVRIPKRPFLWPAARDAVNDWPNYMDEAMRYIRRRLG